MTKTFIQTNEFTKNWSQLGLTDEDLRTLENELLSNPKAGKVFVIQETIYLITVYTKKEKENLSKSERNNIKKLIHTLEKSLS